MYSLKSTQFVPEERDFLFEFFAYPENLGVITPSWLSFQILTPTPVPMRQGALIDYRIGLAGIPTRWRTYISTFEPPHRFVDEQLMGPYDFWHHRHEFESVAAGTLLHDRVVYDLPFGPLGRLVHLVAIRKQLQGIFNHRHKVIAERFGYSVEQPPSLQFSKET